jgi:hypothetical protein
MALARITKIGRSGRRSQPKAIAEDTVVGLQAAMQPDSSLGPVRLRVQGDCIVDFHLGDHEARKLLGFLAAGLGYRVVEGPAQPGGAQ